MSAGPAAGFAVEGPQWTVDAGQPSTFLTPDCGISSDIFSRGWDGAVRGGAYMPSPCTNSAMPWDWRIPPEARWRSDR